MTRRANRAADVTDAVEGLLQAVTGLVGAIRGTIDSGRRVAVAATEVQSVASAKGKKLRRSLKSYWAGLKGKAREERIRKMLAGRGLVPKPKRAEPGAKRSGGHRRRRRRASA